LQDFFIFICYQFMSKKLTKLVFFKLLTINT